MNPKKKYFLITILICLIGTTSVAIIYTTKGDTILTNLKESQFFYKLFGRTPKFIENYQIKEPNLSYKNDIAPILEPEPNPFTDETISELYLLEEYAEMQEESTDSNKNVSLELMNIRLYFMSIDQEGYVESKDIVREMQKTATPLKDAIIALIKGPNSQEAKLGLQTFIPEGTELLDATVKEGIAVLNFNEQFEFNPMGIEGAIGQLKQIIYTATSFPTVESVQILISGQRIDYLSTESVFIGIPLNRSSFID